MTTHPATSRLCTGPAALPPILRWAGGKRWLIPTLRELVAGQSQLRRYYEPFLGGAAVFLGLAPGDSGVLSDLNQELIETYQTVKKQPLAVASELTKHRNTEEYYYELRATVPHNAPQRAARFIYLNHTSYNGIFRVNLQGKYNVPYGHRRNPRIPDAASLKDVSQRLRSFTLQSQDFDETISLVGKNDFVFLDPPYTVAHNDNGFIKYNDKLFSFQDQIRLSESIDRLRSKGAYYVLTNAAHESIIELFDKGDRRMTIHRKNVIGGSKARRGRAAEYLFTNLP